MEDEEGYMAIDPGRRSAFTLPSIPKTEGLASKCCKIAVGILLAGSIALNVALITLLIVFQVRSGQNSSTNSCDLIPGAATDSVTLDPDTAHRRLEVSNDRKSVQWGELEKNLPNNTERFDLRVWVLGKQEFDSGKHCWEVELKGNGEWAVGVAKQSLRRKGLVDFSTKEGLWAAGEMEGKGNYVAFTAPQHTRLSLSQRPQRIRVFLDYPQGLVDISDAEAKVSIYTFSSANFSGEKIRPWFRLWVGTGLKLHP